MNGLRRVAVLVVFVCAGVCARGETVSQLPQPTSYVSDFAEVVDSGSKQQMEQLSREVSEQAHATIVVVTVHSLDGQSIEQFANDLYQKWKVGPKDTDRGVMLLLAINDRKRRIEVGYGLEGILPDGKVGDIGRTMVPYLQRSEYGPGLLEAEQQVANVIAADAHVTLAPVAHPVQQPAPQRGRNDWLGIIIFFVILFFIFGGGRGAGGWLPWFIVGNMMGGGRRGGGWRDGDGGFGGGGGDGGGGDFGGGFGGSSGGGGASGGW